MADSTARRTDSTAGRAVAGQFAADHAPGAMKLSASLWPCLVLPPEHRPQWLPSPYSYGLHLRGDAPLPEGDVKTLRRGKLLEPVGKVLLLEDRGIEINHEQARRERRDVPALCYLDGMAYGTTWAVEFKSMPERIYRDQWDGEPPWYPRIQAQAQMAIDAELAGVLIVPIVISYAGNPDIPAIYEEPRDDQAGAMLVEQGQAFLEMLRAGELPAPDETVASYDALMKVLKIQPQETIELADAEALDQFRVWQMAKAQKSGGQRLEEAAKRYFALRAGNAAVIEIPGMGRIKRKQVDVSAEKKPRPARTDVRWSLEESIKEITE